MIPVSRISCDGVRSSTLGRRAVDRPALLVLDLAGVVDRLAEQVEDPPERPVADRDRDRPAGVDHLVAALQAVGGVHRDRADAVVAEVLLDLADVRSIAGAVAARSGISISSAE